MSLMPIFQKDVLGVGPEQLGMLLAAPGIGALVSLTTLAVFGDRIRRKGILLLSGLGLFGVFIILFSSLPLTPWFSYHSLGLVFVSLPISPPPIRCYSF